MDNSEINSTTLMERKPYLTKQEVGALLQKKGRNLDKKISQLLAKKYLIGLKNGLYTTNAYVYRQRLDSREFLANVLYFPSYLSLEYVLQKQGAIPEAVFSYTSVTLKPTRTFSNDLGTFMYRTVKAPLFTGYQLVPFTDNHQTKIASLAKALFDLLYLKPLPASISGKRQVIEDLRIDWSVFNPTDFSEFDGYVQMAASKKMRQVGSIISKAI